MNDPLPLDLEGLRALANRAEDSASPIPLIDTPNVFVGMKTFQPGEVFANHYHETYDEYFAGLEGSTTVWVGDALQVVLTEGTSVLCRRGVHHMLVNDSNHPSRIIFCKTPKTLDDTIWVP